MSEPDVTVEQLHELKARVTLTIVNAKMKLILEGGDALVEKFTKAIALAREELAGIDRVLKVMKGDQR